VTGAEYTRVARKIKERLDALDADNTDGREALRDVAVTVADIYAGTNRMPDTARRAFLAYCGITG